MNITELSTQYHLNYKEVGTKDAAKIYGVSERTVINWCNNGKLKNSKKIDKKWIIFILTKQDEKIK
jgi:predicted site-specific integrase-resolvase